MASTLLPVQQFFNPHTGAFLALGKVYSYEAESSTPKNLHTGSDGGTDLDNPATLTATGLYTGGMWGAGSYRIVVKDVTEAITVLDVDHVNIGVDAVVATGNLAISSNTITASSGDHIIFQTANAGTYQFKGTASQAAWLDLYEDTDNGTNKVTIKAPSSLTADRTIQLPDHDLSQWLVQFVYNETGAVATGTTVMVNDDTIPQSGEGIEFMTQAITPKNTTNLLIIDVTINLASSAGTSNQMIVGLYQDATANALAAVSQIMVNNLCETITFRHVMVAGTTSATTFKVRAGLSAAGTTTFNGASGARLMGGVMASSISIMEVTA